MRSKLDRRTFLATAAAAASAGGVSLGGWLGRLAAAAQADGQQRRPKSCILLWMAGGPSHIDTFDPKPEAPADVRRELARRSCRKRGLRPNRSGGRRGTAG